MDTHDTENNKAVDLVYLDFQKAFDKVPHERMMVKVNAHGIQGDAARWIRNWLAGRRQRVCINQSYSNWAPAIPGVPQGSVLGPLLFLIYIIDLDTNIVSKISKFADDTKLCHRVRNPDDIMELQEDINKLVEWVNKWQMSFNVDKYSVIHIGQNNMQSNYIRCPINSANNRSTAGSRNHHHQRPQVAKTNRKKAAKQPTEYWGSLPAISVTKTKN